MVGMADFAERMLERRRAQEELGHRERVEVCLNHDEPDRVPIDLWATPEVKARIVRELGLSCNEDLLRLVGVDFRVIRGPSLVGLELESYPDGRTVDLWGVVRRPVGFGRGESRGIYKEVVFSPLADATTTDDIDDHNWPDPDWWDYSKVEEECRRHEGYCVVFAGDRLDRTAQLKTAMYLRGMSQVFRDMRTNPEVLKRIISHIVEYFLEYDRRVFEAARGSIDVFMMGDDFGMQTGPMMPMATWREYFEEGFREFIELAHEYDVRVMHHTCGSVRELIPAFIEADLDILQSLQPRAAGMELGGLKRDFGSRIAMHGSVDIQRTLPMGYPGDVRAEVRERLSRGKPGGGFIICTAHNIQVDTPVANILELLESYHDYAYYAR